MKKNNLEYEINIFGLGYVGLTLAAKILSLKMPVNGYEISNKILNSLNIKKKAHFLEPKINEILSKSINNGKFKINKKLNKKLTNRSINIITVGTPIINGKVFMKSIFSVCKEIENNLENRNSVIILRSTVKIGTTRKLIKKFKKKIAFSFCPERTIEGAAIKELSINPQIIATEDHNTRSIVNKFFYLFNKNLINVNLFEEGEIIKLFDNTYRDIHFSIGNEFSKIADNLGLNGSKILQINNLDYSRTNIPKPGLVGGPCLEKDPYILLKSINIRKNNLISVARGINESMVAEGINKIGKIISFKKIKKVCIVGLSFKGIPKTNDLRGSNAIKIIKKLKSIDKNLDIFGFDPNINIEDFNALKIKKFDKKIKYDLIILQNNAKFLKKYSFNKFKKCLSKIGIIFDFWSNFSKNDKKYFLNV